MTRLRTTIFTLFVAAAAIISLPSAPHAEDFSYSASSSSFLDFGELGGFSPSGQPQTTEIFDIGFNVGGGANLLGCAGISLEGFMDVFASFEHVFDNFLNNIKQAFFRRLLVEAFSRLPQIGALFDTVNAMGNARFEMFNESCDINSVRADARALMEKRCIEGGGNPLQCNPATAQDSFLSNIGNQVNAQLEAFHNKMRNVSNPLRGAMCEYTDTRPGCALMSFLPQFNLCYSLGTNSGASGGGIGGCTQTRAASAPVGPDALFGNAQSLAQDFVGAGSDSIVYLARNMPPAQLQALANSFDITQASAADTTPADTPATDALISSFDDGALNLTLAAQDMKVIHFAGSEDSNVDKFRRFLHCSNADPTYALNKFGEHIGETGPLVDKAQIMANNDILDFDNNASALTNTALADAGGAQALVGTAVGCILNHQLHVSLDSYIALTRLPAGDRKAFAAAAGNRVAYLATEVILRYLRQKVLEAHAQLAAGMTPEDTLRQALEANGTDQEFGPSDFETPEPVLIAVRTIADMFENQIQALRAIRTERDIFASMNSVVYEKIQENKERAEEFIGG